MKKVWPVPQWQSQFSYKQHPRSFGSKRSQGRTHAGCDLYAPLGSEVLAISAGRVVSARKFYMGTFEVSIDHGALGVVRYGEIAVAPGLDLKSNVEAGQVIGYVASLGRGIPPMLHIEQFKGGRVGPLTDRSNPPYLRRADLVDITPLLDDMVCSHLGGICKVVAA